jgi:predicted ATPase
LWVEELTRWVAESAPEATAVRLPDALADVVLARLEQLPPLAKQVLQTASVIGREFTFRMLRQVWDGEEQLDAALLELESRALCYAKRDAWEPVYGFAHSVLQELAYTSLAPLHRLRLHAAVGEALETFYADCLEQVAGVLAWHYAQSERTEKALEYRKRRCGRGGSVFETGRPAHAAIWLFPHAGALYHLPWGGTLAAGRY